MTAKELYIMVAETIIQLMEWVIKCVEEESFINLIIEDGVVRELPPGEQPEPEPKPFLYKINMLGHMNVYEGPSMDAPGNGYAIKGTVEYVYEENNSMLRLSPDDSPSPRWIAVSAKWIRKV